MEKRRQHKKIIIPDDGFADLVDQDGVRKVPEHSGRRKKSKVNEKKKARKREIHCPQCKTVLRIPDPPPTKPGRCPKCRGMFVTNYDGLGNISVTGLNQYEEIFPVDEGLTLETAFEILGVDSSHTPEAIRKAYTGQIKRYHPDKVSQLGVKLQEVAEAESKQINSAYRYLKERGIAI